MTPLVLDTTVLSNFALIGRFSLLPQILSKLSPLTTPQVLEELSMASELGDLFALSPAWLTVVSLTNAEHARFQGLCERVGQGEASCLSVALTRGFPLATDDRKARQIALQLGVTVTGTIGLLLHGIRHQTLTLPEADAILHAMIRQGYFSPIQSLREIMEPE